MLGARKADIPSSSIGVVGTSDRGSSIPSHSSTFQVATSGEWSKESVHSIVDKHLTMKGDLESDGDILVRGKVIGNIKCKLLIVDVDAAIEGGIEAEEVVIRGKSKGKIQSERVRLEKTANVDCEIIHRSFSAEEGARIRGTLRFLDDAETAKGSDDLPKAA